MENEIMNQEVIETEEPTVPNEELEVDATYEPSLGESLAALAIMTAPLAISYVVGVVTGDKVKAKVAATKDKISTFFENRKNKKKTGVDESIDVDFVDVDEIEK